MERLFSALVVLTVVLTVASLGLVLSPRAVGRAVRARVLAPAIVANVLVLPALAIGVAEGLPMTPAQTTGVVVVSVGAGGALGLKIVELAGVGDTAVALAVVVLLEVIDVAALPLWLRAVAPHGSFEPGVPLRSAALMVLAPLLAGMVLCRLRPRLAPRLSRVLAVAGTVALAGALATGVLAYVGELQQDLLSWIMVAAVTTGLLAMAVGGLAGRLAGSAGPTLAMVTVVRFSSLGLAVADRTFAGDRGVHGPAVVTALVLLAMSVGFSLVVRHRVRRPPGLLSARVAEVGRNTPVGGRRSALRRDSSGRGDPVGQGPS